MVERMLERGGQSVYLMLCTVVDGKGKVSYRPSNIRPGYRAVVQGTDDLRATEWTTVTTETSSLHFFKVVIEME